LAQAAAVVSVKYDMVLTAPGEPLTTQKVWLKKGKMRMELTAEGQNMVYLIDSDAKMMYMYIPVQNMAMKMDFSLAPEAATESLALEGYNPVAIGTETLDGKVCLVVEYTVQGVKTKSWIWKEKGFPIRMETATPQGTMVMEFKNIEFVDIPDSMFELPAGVQIVQFPG
jgi:outer membrane lipoprotein-sorting protein